MENFLSKELKEILKREYAKGNIILNLGDITKVEVDAIVNAANETLLGGGGVDGAIHEAAGPSLLEECKTLGGCRTGEAKITKGYNLPAKNVIHTVGPIYDTDKNVEKLLSNCYTNSLKLIVENNLNSIAFPGISTGVYGYPKEDAARIAIESVLSFIKNNKEDIKVIFVSFSQGDFNIYKKLFEESMK